jgi:amino acid transporter
VLTEATELPATTQGDPSTTLESGRLPLWKATAFGLAAMQVGPGLGYSAAYVQGVAGDAAWLALIVALAGILTVAVAVAAHARRYVVTGSLMSYAFFSLGPNGRLVAGGALLIGYLIAMASCATTVVLFGTGTLVDLGAHGAADTPAQLALALVVTGFASLLAYRGIDTSVRVGLILGFACVPVVIIVLIGALLRHGVAFTHEFDFVAMSPRALVDGSIVALGFYVGFDGVTSLAAETQNPTHNVPRILIGCLLILGVLMVLSCVLEAPLIRDHKADLDAGVSPLAIVGRQGRIEMLSTVGDGLLTLACLASTIAFANFGARVIATAASDGFLPDWLASIHPLYRSPHKAVVIQGVVGGLIPLVVGIPLHTSPIELTTYTTNMMVYIWLIPYTVICIGAVVIEVRQRTLRAGTLLSGIAGAIGCIYLIVHSLSSPIGLSERLASLSYCLVVGSIGLCWWASRRPRKGIA